MHACLVWQWVNLSLGRACSQANMVNADMGLGSMVGIPSSPPSLALPALPKLQVLQPRMPSSLFRIFTSIIRGLNNMAGGISFVMIAKALGVQKAAEAK